ncbi:hypothetical protein R2Q81_12585 [Microbacterium aquimaris]|uniref:hypothetical protein n=1 Tax=Microbacterium aquimaris TaxID=459816 RepID=UPI002AD46DC4|nr:hypothetical protein [Microbacterium aquimaris]MDZ8276778.1 hypothetical protein [Microbacterium aquimaris]
MESVVLEAPEGIAMRLGWDPSMSEHDRKRALARELVAEHLGIEQKKVRVEREAPAGFGFHTQLIAEVDGTEVPVGIRNASFRAATIVAVADPAVPIGLDLRDTHPDEGTVHEMQRHSHLLDETDIDALVRHWTRVQAVRDADGRGARVRGEHVRLDSSLAKGWIPDRRIRYQLADLSRDGWVITLAYGALPV